MPAVCVVEFSAMSGETTPLAAGCQTHCYFALEKSKIHIPGGAYPMNVSTVQI